MFFELDEDALSEGRRKSDEYHLGVRAVFSLREKVSCNKGWAGAIIGDNQYLRGAGGEVDGGRLAV